MSDSKPIIVEFPLRGEWLSPVTPGKQVPSHGTDRLGSRYAFDFLQVDWTRGRRPAYHVHPLAYALFGASLDSFYCWGKPIHAPFDGVVAAAEDGCRERQRAHVLSDFSVAFKSAHSFDVDKDGLQFVAGNYVILESPEGFFAALVHMQEGSVRVSEGQRVSRGDELGRVGHSGNSFSPHLHFQLMDGFDMMAAKGLPCAFAEYEVCRHGIWEPVRKGIPSDQDRIRFNG